MPLRPLSLLAAGLFGIISSSAHAAPPAKTAVASENAGFDIPAVAVAKGAPGQAAFPDSGAITLRDESLVHLNADGSATETTHETVKIFNQRGRGYADVMVPFNSSTQSVTGIHARTIRPDGKVLIVQPAEIHESSPYSDYTMYDDAKTVAFSMPGVEDGAIVEYTYTTVSRKGLLADQYASNWAFQEGQNPVVLSRLTVVAPTTVALSSQLHNTSDLKPEIKTSADGAKKTYVWEMKNLPDITPEPMMPPANTYLPWMEVSTIPSWQTIAQWYQKLAEPRMAADPEIKTLTQQLIAGKTTDTEKARALFYWVEGKTRYVALELGLSAYQPHAAADVCRNRYGDCKDMATLLVTMLHEAGIKTAWPVLLDAGNKQPSHDHLASPGAFDHAIVRADIDGKPYWFDSTAELCTFGDIPGSDRGVDAFVVRDGVGTWETIPVGTSGTNQVHITTHVILAADGSADCDTDTESAGDAALSLRSSLRAVKPNQMQEGFRNIVSGMSANAVLKNFTLSPIEDRDKPMAFDCTYHAPLWAVKTGNLLLVNTGDHENADSVYDRPSRTYPLYNEDAGQMVADTIVTLPPDYTVDDKPDDVHETNPLGALDVTYTVTGNTLTIHVVQSSTPGTVPATDFASLKAAHDKIAAALKTPVVLKHIAAK